MFGKTMKNIWRESNHKLLTEWSRKYGAETYISKPEFKNITNFIKDLVAVEIRKLGIWLNKPIYVGQAILYMVKTAIY